MNDNSKYLIEKSNVLNCFTSDEATGSMNLIEYRFFCLYLSKLNPYSSKDNEIKIYLDEFSRIFNAKINMSRMIESVRKTIFDRKVTIIENRETVIIHLYSKFKISEDKKYIAISANQELMPYISELKSNYTKYVFKNIVNLNSVSKIRLYELMVQYAAAGEAVFELEYLKKMLLTQFTEFKNFNRSVLQPAVKDINCFTDLDVEVEKILSMRKVTELRFIIKRKKNIKAFIDEDAAGGYDFGDESDEENPQSVFENTNPNPNHIMLHSKYFASEGFSLEDVSEFINAVKQQTGREFISIDDAEDYIEELLSTFREQSEKRRIRNKKAYILGLIKKMDIFSRKKKSEESYDIDEFEKFAVNYEEVRETEQNNCV